MGEKLDRVPFRGFEEDWKVYQGGKKVKSGPLTQSSSQACQDQRDKGGHLHLGPYLNSFLCSQR